MRNLVALDQPGPLRVHSVGDTWREPKVSGRVQDPQAGEVAVVPSSALECLAFALVAPLRTEQARSLTDEHVPVDNPPVIRIVDDADV